MFRCEGSVGSKTIQKRQKHGHHWSDRREDCDEPVPGDFTRRHVRSHKLLSSVRSVAGTSGESCHNDCGGRDFTASGPQLKLNFEACTCISNLELRNYKIQVQGRLCSLPGPSPTLQLQLQPAYEKLDCSILVKCWTWLDSWNPIIVSLEHHGRKK